MTSVTQTETVRHTSWFSCFSSSDSGGKAPERTLQREDSALSREGFRAVEAATTKQFRSEGHPCRHRFTPLDTVRDVHNSRRDGNRGTLGARTSSGTVHSLSSVLDIQREVRPGPRVSHRRSESAVPASTPAQLMPQDWRGLRQFEFVGDIGCTSTMVTKLMQNRMTGELVAITFVHVAPSCVDAATEAELLNHRRLESPHVVRLQEVFRTDHCLAVVTDHVPGGTLFRHVTSRGRLREESARTLFRQLLSGLGHCHSQGIYHRDLKVDSLRLDEDGALQIANWGYSHSKLSSAASADGRDPAASPSYSPPEVLLGHSVVNTNYDGEILDIWAVGVILYFMIFGAFPFEEAGKPRSVRTTMKHIVRLEYDFPPAARASEGVKALLSAVFVRTKAARITLPALAEHPWTTAGGALPPVHIASGPPPESPTSRRALEPDTPLSGDGGHSGGRGLFGRRGNASERQTEQEVIAVVRKAYADAHPNHR